MTDSNQVIGTNADNGTPLLLKDVVKGSRVKEWYIKCPHIDKKCKWHMGHDNIYDYLNDTCYLSGCFAFDCPD